MKTSEILKLCLLVWAIQCTPCMAAEDTRLHDMAVQAAEKGDLDFAFMRYRTIVLEYPKSVYRPRALFAQGEYFFDQHNYEESSRAFQEFIRDYPESDANLFALVYLLKIAESRQENDSAQDLIKDIVNLKQISLIFRDYKEYEFLSPLNRKCKAIFHIDTIEFYSEDRLFAKISF